MKLSTKGRYGVKAILDLAINNDKGPISLKSIAENQDLSEAYLEQLFSILRKAELIKSVRGAQGGYLLAAEPSHITVGEIIRALEGPIAPVNCVADDEDADCFKADNCVTRIIWAKIRDSINQVVDSITLQDMIDDYKKIHGNDTHMYYI